LKNKCIIILSEKSSGSSACQNLLAKFANIKHVSKTRHFQNETLYWTKAASIMARPQVKMVDSEVPIERDKARNDLICLLRDNIDNYEPPGKDEDLIFKGWRALCLKYSPIFLEKSPHHLCQWSALELIIQCMATTDEIDFLLIGLIRNPMDTIYSQYTRWKSPPEKIEEQWFTAYKNLLKVKALLDDKVVIIRYEDMVNSINTLEPVFNFCEVEALNADSKYLHNRSIHKWKNDMVFRFALSPETLKLAESYGYHKDDLSNQTHILSPVIRRISRAAYLFIKPSRRILRKFRKN
jgi:hypothetical protein